MRRDLVSTAHFNVLDTSASRSIKDHIRLGTADTKY